MSRPRSSSLLTQKEYKTYCLTCVDYTVAESELEHDSPSSEELSYPWAMNCETENRRSERSSVSSGSLTDDSVEICYSPLELKHFETAVNQGAFSEASHDKKRERRKSFNKLCKKLSFDHTSKPCEPLDSNFDEYLPRNEQRRRASLNVDSRPKSSSRRKHSPHHKIRRQLAHNGIDFLDTSMDLSLDEIHDLQQKFYSNLNLADTKRKISDCGRENFGLGYNRKRSQSFF